MAISTTVHAFNMAGKSTELGKVRNWGTWFPGNFVIWREIYKFETKKYIRNVGKYCRLGGKFYNAPGKSNIFFSHGGGHLYLKLDIILIKKKKSRN